MRKGLTQYQRNLMSVARRAGNSRMAQPYKERSSDKPIQQPSEPKKPRS